MITWHSTSRLTLDRDGTLWLWLDPGFRRLGPIDAAGDVIDDDLAGELLELLELWEDGFDERAEQLWSYRMSVRL